MSPFLWATHLSSVGLSASLCGVGARSGESLGSWKALMVVESFDTLPHRLFLDSCTVQTLRDYGGFIWEGEPIDQDDVIRRVTDGHANVVALRDIFLINERSLFEWVVTEASVAEAEAKNDAGHLQWVYDVLDHTQVCLEECGGPTAESQAMARRLDEPCFGYLSEKDRVLVRDAVLLCCDAFLTMETRLPRNADHIQRELGLMVLTPVDYWGLLSPWAGLYR